MFYWISIIIPVLATIPLFMTYGYPEAQPLSRDIFWIQMACTIAVIVALPVCLRFIQPGRFKTTKTYMQMCNLRLLLFLCIALANLLVGFMLSIPSGIYLALITWIGLFFCKPQPKD